MSRTMYNTNEPPPAPRRSAEGAADNGGMGNGNLAVHEMAAAG